MRSGRMRFRVQIIRRDATVVSATGAPTGEWLPVTGIGTIWAAIEPVNGRESWTGASYASEAEVKIFTRYWEDLKLTDRIRYEDKDYEILGILDVKMLHKEFELPCKWIRDMGDGANG